LLPVVTSWKVAAYDDGFRARRYSVGLMSPIRWCATWSAIAAMADHCGVPALVPPKRKNVGSFGASPIVRLHTAQCVSTPPLTPAL
jgi:hypothetical protein